MDSIRDNLNKLRLKTTFIPMNNELYDLINQLIVEVIKVNDKINNINNNYISKDYIDPIDMSVM